MKFVKAITFLCFILLSVMILCKNDKCSISQTKNTNCRSIATYCAIELYLLNDPCALFKRMDILLGNPKQY